MNQVKLSGVRYCGFNGRVIAVQLPHGEKRLNAARVIVI